MPDKEFDNLFREKFENAEIEPSANLWANIEHELGPQRKKSTLIYWAAAAAVTISISAMLVFQEKEVIKLQGQDTAAKVEESAPVDRNIIESVIEAPTVQQTEVASKRAEIKSAKVVETPIVKTPIEPSQNNQVAVQPSNNPDRLLIKSMDAKPLDVVPVKEAAVTDNQTVYANLPINNKTEDVIADDASEKKGIRNVGDLVNYVVEKVDKRDKKLVRFNTDDDDNSSIVGINIGFLKFNKKNK